MPTRPDNRAVILREAGETISALKEAQKIKTDKANTKLIHLIGKLYSSQSELEQIRDEEPTDAESSIISIDLLLVNVYLKQIDEILKIQFTGISSEAAIPVEKELTKDDESIAKYIKFSAELTKSLDADKTYNPEDRRIKLAKSVKLLEWILNGMRDVAGKQSVALEFEQETLIPAQNLLERVDTRIKKLKKDQVTNLPEYTDLDSIITANVNNTITDIETRILVIDKAKVGLKTKDTSTYSKTQKDLINDLITQTKKRIAELNRQKDILTRTKDAQDLNDLLTLLKIKASVNSAEIAALNTQKDLVETNIKNANEDTEPIKVWETIVNEVESFLDHLESVVFEARADVKDIRTKLHGFKVHVGKPGEYAKSFLDKETAKQDATKSINNFELLITALEGVSLSPKQEELKHQLIKEAKEVITFIKTEIEGFLPNSKYLIDLVDEIITGLTRGTYKKFDESTFTQEFRNAGPTKLLSEKFDEWTGLIIAMEEAESKGELSELMSHTLNILRLHIGGYNYVQIELMSESFVKTPDSEAGIAAWWALSRKYKPTDTILSSLEYYGAVGENTGATDTDLELGRKPKDFSDIVYETYFKFFSGSESNSEKEQHLKSGYMVVEERINSKTSVLEYFLTNKVKFEAVNTNHGLLNKAMLDGEFEKGGKNFKIIDLTNAEYIALSTKIKEGKENLKINESELFKGLNRESYLLDSVQDPDPTIRKEKQERLFERNPDRTLKKVNPLVFGVIQDLVLLDVQARARMERETRGGSPVSQEQFDGSTYSRTMSSIAKILYTFQSKGGQLPPDVLFLDVDILESTPTHTSEFLNTTAKNNVPEEVWRVLKQKIIDYPVSIESLLGVSKKDKKKVLNLLSEHYHPGHLHKLFDMMSEDRLLFRLHKGDDLLFPSISKFLLTGTSMSEMFLAIKGWIQLNSLDIDAIQKGEKLDEKQISDLFAAIVDKGYSIAKLSRFITLNKTKSLFRVYLSTLILKYKHNTTKQFRIRDEDTGKLKHLIVEDVGQRILKGATFSNMNKGEGEYGLYRYEVFSDLFTPESIANWIVRDFKGNKKEAQKSLLDNAGELTAHQFYEYIIKKCGFKINKRLFLNVEVESMKKMMISHKLEEVLESYDSRWHGIIRPLWLGIVGTGAKVGWGELGRNINSTKEEQRNS